MINHKSRSAIEAAWSKETAAVDNDWTAANPATGHCDVSSLVVRELAGGDLKMAQVFHDGELIEHHYWNVLPDGVELDLTRQQFDGTETFGDPTLLDEVFFESAGPMNQALIDRLDRFRDAVNEQRRLGS